MSYCHHFVFSMSVFVYHLFKKKEKKKRKSDTRWRVVFLCENKSVQDLFVCFCLFISVLSFEIQLSEWKVWIPLTSLTLPHLYACSRPGPGCQMPLWCVFLC